MKRRILSAILSLAMVLALLPVTAWAEETEPEEAAETVIPPGGAEAPDTAVEDVQALIDALPAVEEVRAMDMDGQRTVYDQTQTAYDAYMALPEERRGLITGAGVFEELFAFFNGQIMPLVSVNYVDGNTTKSADAAAVTSGTTTLNGPTTSWYVVNSDVTIDDRITVIGTVNLILADGKTLTANNGIQVGRFYSLTIWGQSGQSGKLVATVLNGDGDTYWNAGIGGGSDGMSSGSITINGGVIEATGGKYSAGIGSGGSYYADTFGGTAKRITINGGNVTATGGYLAAGIGGGAGASRGGDAEEITITGGTVTAAGGSYGAGIGGGYSAGSGGTAGSITITGGNITATGDYLSAGIGGGGGGTGGDGGTINISGGTVIAAGGSRGAGIGGGSGSTGGSGGTITISGGTVTATGGQFSAGIGGGGSSNDTSGTGGDGGTITISGGTVTAKGGSSGTGIGGGRGGNSSGTSGSAGTIRITGGTVNASGGSRSPGIGGGGGYSSGEARSGSVIISGGTITANRGSWAQELPVGGIGPVPTFQNYNHLTFNGNTLVEWPGTSASDWNNYGTVKIVPTGGSLSVTAPTFSAVTYGYSRPSAQDISITGTATVAKVELTSGTDAFDLSNSNNEWRIQPKDKLNAGTYYATVTATYWVGATETKATATVSFTVNKANSSVTNAPTARANLIYNGSAQNLINGGTASNGTMQYSLSQGSGYSTNIPTGIAAGSYTVWYKVVGNENYNDVAAQSITVTINKATPGVTPPTANNTTYNGQAQALVNAGSTTAGTMQYCLTQNGTYSTSIPTGTAAGPYTVWYKVVGNDNYNDVNPTSIQATISKATPGVTAPTANNLTYTGNAQALVTAGSTTAGTMQYCLTQNGTYSTTIPTGTDARNYTVWYKVVGNENYNDVAAQSVPVTISKATPVVTAPTANNTTYDGAEHPLVTAGSTTAGTMQYCLTQNGIYSTTIPTGTDARTYTVYYKVVGDSNYNDVAVSSPINVTIAKAAQAAPTEIKVSKSTDTITVTAPTGTSPDGTQYQYYVGAAAPNENDWSDSPNFAELNPGSTYTVYVRCGGDTNHFASEHVTTTVTTLGEDGSATLQSGESVKTENGTTVTNHGGNITVEDDDGHTTTVTPPEGEDFSDGVGVDGNGNVTVPEGSTVHPGNDGPEITVEDEATVDAGGKITFPGGGSAEVNGDTVTVPEGGILKPDGEGGVEVPGGSTVTPEGGPGIVLGEHGGTVNTDGSVTLPEGGSAEVNGDTVTAPKDGGTLTPDGEDGVKVPGGSTVTPEGGPDIVLGEQGGTVDTDGSVTLPEGGSAQIGDTTVTVPECGASDPDGEDGEDNPGEGAHDPDEGTSGEVPGGGTLKPDGEGGVEVPDGSTVRTGEDSPEIEIEQGPAIVDEDGNITFPEGGSVKIGGTTVTVPEDGTLTPNRDGTVNVPPGSKVTDEDGKESIVPSQGGKIGPDGTYKDNPSPSSPSYAVAVSETEHGKVTVSPTRAYIVQTVTVTVTPDEGYQLSKLTVTDSRGNELTLTDKGNGTYTFIMPSRAVTVMAAFTLIVSEVCDGGPDCPGYSFTDLNADAWYHEYVDYVISHGLMECYYNGIFGPNDTLSRAMLAQILYNLEGGVPANYLMQYDDVPTDAWYAEAIRWAASEGIVHGYGNGAFGPDDPITREQLAVMLYRYEQSKVGVTESWVPQLTFADTAEISDWAYDAIGWCTANGIIEGKGSGILAPKDKATRAEVAAMIMRFLLHLMGK